MTHTFPFRSVHADLLRTEFSTTLPLTQTTRPCAPELKAPLTTTRSPDRFPPPIVAGAVDSAGIGSSSTLRRRRSVDEKKILPIRGLAEKARACPAPLIGVMSRLIES